MEHLGCCRQLRRRTLGPIDPPPGRPPLQPYRYILTIAVPSCAGLRAGSASVGPARHCGAAPIGRFAARCARCWHRRLARPVAHWRRATRAIALGRWPPVRQQSLGPANHATTLATPAIERPRQRVRIVYDGHGLRPGGSCFIVLGLPLCASTGVCEVPQYEFPAALCLGCEAPRHALRHSAENKEGDLGCRGSDLARSIARGACSTAAKIALCEMGMSSRKLRFPH